MLKKFLLIVLLSAIPFISYARVNRLITVNTPYVDTEHILKLHLIGYKPLSAELNLDVFGLFDVSAETIVPFWFLDSPNFGLKISLDLPVLPIDIAASYHLVQFTGEEEVINLIEQQFPDLPIQINYASLNFVSSKVELMGGIELGKFLRGYLVIDMMFYGNEHDNSAYFHPTLGADIQLGKLLNIFGEIGYYFVPQEDYVNELSGMLSWKLPSKFTMGAGVEIDMGMVNIRAGAQYPGFSVQYGATSSDVFELPFIPYVDLSLQF